MCTAPCRIEECFVPKPAAMRLSRAAAAARSRDAGVGTLGPRLVEKRDLLSAARTGDRDAAGRLLLPYATGLYLSALRLTGNSSDAEDVRQEALLRAISRLGQFTGSSGNNEHRDDLQAWVARIGTNASIDVIRRRREGKLFSLEQPRGESDETIGSGIPERSDNPEERLARKEMRALLAETIVQLPPDLRQVCLLQDVLHYSTQEVAERLGISLVAVRLRLFRARRKLRERIKHRLNFPQPRAARRARTPRHEVCERMPPSAVPEFACGD